MQKEFWTSRTTTTTAFIGSAVGLSNVWGTPSYISNNGGFIYLIFYILISATITFSFFLGLIALGRIHKGGVISVFNKGIASWRLLGYLVLIVVVFVTGNYLSILGNILGYAVWTLTGLYNIALTPAQDPHNSVKNALSFYDYWTNYNPLTLKHLTAGTYIWDKVDSLMPLHSVGKILTYGLYRINHLYANTHPMNLSDFQYHYDSYKQSKLTGIFSSPVTYTTIMILSCFILLRKHINLRLEKFILCAVLLAFALMFALLIHSIYLPHYSDSIADFLKPKSYNLLSFLEMIKNTIIKSFFSLSIGFGISITYGGYVKKEINLIKVSFSVIAMDIISSVCMGFIVFPIIHQIHLQDYGKENFLFVILPLLFSHIQHGIFWSEVFYSMLVLLGITSVISLVEVFVCFLREKTGLERQFVALLSCGIISFITIHIDLSYGPLSLLKIYGWHLYTIIDVFSSKLGIPIVTFFISVYVGWIERDSILQEITTIGKIRINVPFTKLWIAIVRYIIPIFCLYTLIENLYKFFIV